MDAADKYNQALGDLREHLELVRGLKEMRTAYAESNIRELTESIEHSLSIAHHELGSRMAAYWDAATNIGNPYAAAGRKKP